MHAQVSSADDNRLLRSIPAARVALIERIAAAGRARERGGRTDLQQRFLRAYFRGVGEEDLAERTPRVLASAALGHLELDRKSTRLNSSHQIISYAVFCLKKKNTAVPLG